MNLRWSRNSFVYILFLLIIVVLLVSKLTGTTPPEDMSISEVAKAIRNNEVETVIVNENHSLEITLRGDVTALSQKDPSSSAMEQIAQLGVTSEQLEQVEWINQKPNNLQAIIQQLLLFAFPVLLIGGIIYYMMRQAQGSNNQALSFGKSRAKMFTGDHPTVSFEDVAGCDEAKEGLAEIVEFLQEPEKFMALGARIPKGVLLVGAPGTGKTLMAKAVSGEAGVPFFSISGSEFVEMFVGVGASRVRDLFEQARRHSPCIIFIDEIDAVGRQRGTGLGGSHDEREQTLNQILVEMDGFDTDTNIIIIAATNRPDILDPALLRPGRFDRRVTLDRPDVRGREQILNVHVKGKPLASNVDLSVLARITAGFVGADIENMVNEAAILTVRRDKLAIGMSELQEAIERVMMGPERRSRIVTPEERRLVAYHEAGHAVIGHLLPDCDPVIKVTIIPRGTAGGYTLSAPGDITYLPRKKILADLVMFLGGRTAEELVLKEITTGAGSDLQRVTQLARAMVKQYGMSDLLGPMVYGKKEEMVFLGREISEQRDYSEAVAEMIDEEVRRIVNEAHDQARILLTENMDKLELVAQTLLEIETLDQKNFARLMDGLPLELDEPEPVKPVPSGSPQTTDDSEDESPSLDLPPAPAPA